MLANTVPTEHALKAAIYARYSTDKQDASSIADQIRVCSEFADAHGWVLAKTYADEAISGAATGNRPQFNLAMRDASDKQFSVLLVMDLSRLSRSAGDLNKAIDRLNHRGTRVIGVQDGYDSDRKGHKLQAGFSGIMGEAFREMVRDKTYEALAGRAKRGSHTGGRTYGYSKAVLDPITNISHREIDESEAVIVKRIFEAYANGKSPRKIAEELNALNIPSPRGGTWAASAIYGDIRDANGILNNELYVGCQIWNRRQWLKDPDSGKRTYVRRPESEWLRTTNEAWRIVDAALWDRVKHRREQINKGSTEIQKALHRNARTGAGPKYLFSGLLRCACCGAPFVISDGRSYGCSYNRDRGPTVCGNRLRVPRSLVEARLLDAIKAELFSDAAIELFVKETTRLLTEQSAKRKPELEQAKQRLAKTISAIGNLLTAIKEGYASASVKAELGTAEAEKESLLRFIAGTEENARAIVTALPNAVVRYRALIDNLDTTLQRDIDRARHQLRTLLGEIKLHPTDGHLEAELSGDFERLLTLAAYESGKTKVKLNVVAGTGFEPVTFGL